MQELRAAGNPGGSNSLTPGKWPLSLRRGQLRGPCSHLPMTLHPSALWYGPCALSSCEFTCIGRVGDMHTALCLGLPAEHPELPESTTKHRLYANQCRPGPHGTPHSLTAPAPLLALCPA